jgi:polar amino acid transport system permease protein
MMNDLTLLAAWTPFLMGGFLWNVIVTVMAVVIGTLIGAWFAAVRYRNRPIGRLICEAFSKLFRNVPTLAFMFAAVFILPREFQLYGSETVIQVPLWLKAALGLSASVIGFTSESLLIARQARDKGDFGAAMLFLPTWGNSVLITFVASSTASLAGVSELISRCNSVIAATGSASMVAVYLYAAIIYTLACVLWMVGLAKFRTSRLAQSLPQRWAEQARLAPQ